MNTAFKNQHLAVIYTVSGADIPCTTAGEISVPYVVDKDTEIQ